MSLARLSGAKEVNTALAFELEDQSKMSKSNSKPQTVWSYNSNTHCILLPICSNLVLSETFTQPSVFSSALVDELLLHTMYTKRLICNSYE